MDYPVFRLHADTYEKTKYYVKVINKDTVPTHLWIGIPNFIAVAYDLYRVCNMKNSGPEPVEGWSDHLEHIERTPWYKFDSEIFDWDVGTHFYRLRFESAKNDDGLDLYFRYIIQDGHPEKPYLYMDPENRCGCV